MTANILVRPNFSNKYPFKVQGSGFRVQGSGFRVFSMNYATTEAF
jgi:hypothetical protein